MMTGNKRIKQLLLVSVVLILLIILSLIAFTGYHKKKVNRIGFIMTGTVNDTGWNEMHYQGIRSACDQLGAELIVKENVAEGTKQCENAILELKKEGAEVIILSSYAYPGEVQDVIRSCPDIHFYGSSAEYSADNMTSYFGRMYQARYLSGVVAGMQTQNNRIGYVAAMPNNEVNRGINAFTLGVKSVNEDAEVFVVWTDSWENKTREEEATNRLIDEVQVDVITYHQNKNYVANIADARGIYSIGYNDTAQGLSEKYLTAAVWNWEAAYYEIIKEYMQGNANTIKRHWYGIESGVVGLADFSSLVSEETREKTEEAKQALLAGKNIFSGVIYDTEGNMRCNEGEVISDSALFEQMDWYVYGVVIYE